VIRKKPLVCFPFFGFALFLVSFWLDYNGTHLGVTKKICMSKLPAIRRATGTFLPQSAERNLEGSHLETEKLSISVRLKDRGSNLSKLTFTIEQMSI
jgi:hypothetical protein